MSSPPPNTKRVDATASPAARPACACPFVDARDILAARRAVEPGMLRTAGPLPASAVRALRRHVAQERRAIAGCSESGSPGVVLATFHVRLAECLGDAALVESMTALAARTAHEPALVPSAAQAQEASDDHAAIVEALADADLPAAERLMRDHVETLSAALGELQMRVSQTNERLFGMLSPARSPERSPERTPEQLSGSLSG